MISAPKVSIIVPSYNRAPLIGQTLRSLQSQTSRAYEIIIVDDGSTDDTREVIAPYLDQTTRYVKKDNAERGAARNFGASIALGQYLNFFDSDDIALENHVQSICDAIERFSSPEWFHLGFAWATPEGNVFKRVDHFSGNTLNAKLCRGNPLSCNSVILRLDVARAHPFNEDRDLSASEDYELWLRLAARYPLHYSNEVTSLIIDHDLRSVRNFDSEKLVRRISTLIRYVNQDTKTLNFFGPKMKTFYSFTYSYLALHLSELPHEKKRSISYLARSIRASFAIVLTRRFLAIVRNVVLRW